MYGFAKIIKSKNISQIVLQEGKQRRAFQNTFVEIADKPALAIFSIVDLSKFSNMIQIVQKLKNFPVRDYGILAIDRASQKIAWSNFFAESPHVKSIALKAIKNIDDLAEETESENYYFYKQLGISQSSMLFVAIVPRQKKTDRTGYSTLLITFLSLFSCVLFKIIAEKLFLQRGPDLNLSLLIPATFVILIIQPGFAAVYLAEEFFNTSYVAEKLAVEAKLDQKLRNIDEGSKSVFRENLYLVRGLNSVEKMAEYTQTNLVKDDFRSFFKKCADYFVRKKSPLFYSSIWLCPQNQVPFSIRLSSFDKLQLLEDNSTISKIFFARFREKLDLLGNNEKNKGAGFDSEDLKAELAQSFFINIMGIDTFYRFRRNSDLFMEAHSFYKRDFLYSFPILHLGKYFAIITWHFDQISSMRSIPLQKLSTNGDEPVIFLYGDERKILAQPLEIKLLGNEFPDLIKSAKEAHLSRAPISKIVRKKEQSKLIRAIPMDFSRTTIAGFEWIENFEPFRLKILKTAALVFAGLFLVGLFIAFAGARYFTAPIKELTAATEEIGKNNFSAQISTWHPDEFSQIGNSFNKMARGLHEGMVLKSFVSGSVLREVASGAENLSEKARQSFATIVFSGIKGFKKIQAEKSAVEIFAILQNHLSVATDALKQYGGEVDKMIEDKVMIVFEHDEYDSDSHKNAIQAAIAIQKQMMEKAAIEVSIGINSGITISGFMGTEKARLARTVVGDPVNLAARLSAEALKLENSEIVISGYLTEFLPENCRAEKLPISSVTGKTQSIEAYRLRSDSQA